MKSVLVTGANKGIGLAIVEAILREQPQVKAILGSRDLDRGNAAVDALLAIDSTWSERVEVLELDVTSDPSVSEARAQIAVGSGDSSPPLHGVVNNAGAGTGSVREVLDVNVHGIRRVCEAFAPGIASGGRIVNVTSASGPNFVSRCDPHRQEFFRDGEMTWEQLARFMRECEQPGDLASLGTGSGSPYGLSKACANTYTMILAKRHPHLFVNACTPGFIETDLGREFLGARTPSEAGMKSPADGARVVRQLIFGEPRGTGRYFGSDGLRSPMDRYRAPGTPEYTGRI
jgi:NAD(P)-dependent dehydrogenase (short-subunit alcohol dehydrogenase family)